MVGSGVDNLTQVHMQALMHQGGLTKYLICTKLMAFGTDGVSIFQGIRLSGTLKEF